MITVDSPFRSAPRMSRDGFIAVLEEKGSFESDPLWEPIPRAERPAEAGRIYDLVASKGHDPSVFLAIAGKEHTYGTNPSSVLWRNQTRSWTNARSVRDPSLTNWQIITDRERRSDYVRYASVYDSVQDGLYRVDDPAYAYRDAKTILEVISIWAPGSDGNAPRAYAQTMVDWITEWQQQYPVESEQPTMSLIETIGQRIAAHGIEVHDIRDRMPTNGSYSRYSGAYPTHTAVHYTAVRREPASLEAEINSWVGHGRYHVQTQGWPGIAYTIGISMSGRVFLLGEAEQWRYHIFNDNPRAFPVSHDFTLGQEPTPAMLRGLQAVLTVLHEETPEFPNLVRANTYGHQEFGRIPGGDTRNASTNCPGALLPYVQQYRAGAPIVAIPAPPECLTFAEVPFKICHGFRAFWEKHGGLPIFGLPLTGEIEENGMTVQYFERARFEHHPNSNADDFDVVLGRIGAELIESRAT